MIIFSLPVASIALGISIAAIVPTLRDTYGASNLQVGRHHGARCRSASRSARASRRATRAISAAWRCWRSAGAASASRPTCWLAGPLSVVGGIGNGIVIVRFRTMMQRETPPHERASTIGFAYAVTFSMIVVGQIAVVPLSNALGQRATFTIAGTIFALGGCVAALCWPSRSPSRRRRGSRPLPEASPVTAR